MNAQDDSLLHGAAIGDRQGLWRLLNSLPVDQQVTEAFEPAWSVQANDLTTAAATDTDAIVRGMFQMLCNHLESPQAIAAFEPLSLLVLLRGGIHEFDAFVTTLGAVDETQAPHLMVLRPGVFVRLADRVLRAFTCAEVWPALGDLTSCQSAWSEGLLANQPRDPERFQLAMSLAMLSALVVFYHEFAHIIRGHNAWAAETLGVGGLHENRSLPSLHSGKAEQSSVADHRRRAVEVDADIYAGVFMAKALSIGMLGEINEENLPSWCELMAFLAVLTFNVFEEQVQHADYRAGYHLPGIRTECFLEGLASAWEVRDLKMFVVGMNTGMAFCAKHYYPSCNEEETRADLAQLEAHTWPTLVNLRQEFRHYVPAAWQARQGD